MPSVEYLTEHVATLEAEVAHLKYQLRQLISLADLEREPFTHYVLEYDLTEYQVRAIYDLMDEMRAAIKSDNPPSHHNFETRVYEIVPLQNGNYHFAEGIVSSLNRERRYEDVYQYMKKDGMNI
jgi:hypothetical protein